MREINIGTTDVSKYSKDLHAAQPRRAQTRKENSQPGQASIIVVCTKTGDWKEILVPNPTIIKLDPTVWTEPWAPFPEEEISSGTREQAGRVLFEDTKHHLSVGVWEQEQNETNWMTYPFNEFMIVIEGEVVLVEANRTVTVGPGESFFLPKGLRCRWTQPRKVKKLFFIHDDPEGPENPDRLGAVVIDPMASMQSASPCSQHELVYISDVPNSLTISLEEVKGDNHYMKSPTHELVHLIHGSVVVADGQTSHSFAADDTFLVPQGTPASWHASDAGQKISVRLTS